jgi:DNA topoisomerase VI subunit A
MTRDNPQNPHHDLDRRTLALIDATAGDIRVSIDNGRPPKIKLPARGLNNVDYDKARGYFELGSSCKLRSLNVNTVRSFAQTLRLMATSRAMVEHALYSPRPARGSKASCRAISS